MTGPAASSSRILEIEIVGHGGLAHYAYNLSCALAERGHDVTLATAVGYELEDREAGPDSLRIVGMIARASRRLVHSLPAPLFSLWRKVEAILDAFRAAALARKLRPQVVHLHCTNPIALLYLRLLKGRNRLLVSTAHVVTPHERAPFQTAIYGFIYRLPDLVIAHSRFDQERLVRQLGVARERTVVIPHGEYGFFERSPGGGSAPERATARRDLGLSDDAEIALFFGYIREYKGLDVLLDAWPKVAESRAAARLVVAGDPVRLSRQRREELEQRARSVGALHHFGYIPFGQVGGYFAAADVLVMPYRHISQSGVLYLALALGLPVVATRVGGLPELLRDGESALLVAPESPAELAVALVRALGDSGLRQRLAEGGRSLAKEHSWPAIAGRTERAFAAQRERA